MQVDRIGSHSALAVGGWRPHRGDLEEVIEKHLGGALRRPEETGRLRLEDAVMLALQ